MAALLAVGIGLGAEKLGRKISEKRLDRKEKKHAQQRETIYGEAEPSTANASQNRHQISRDGRKSAEVRREQEQEQGERRKSVSSDTTCVEELPRYEDVVRDNQGRT